MKKSIFLVFTALMVTFCAFTLIQTSGIQGKIVPADGAIEVLAVSGKDTLRTQINKGNFSFSGLKPATYTIWVKARAPFKDASVENVAVIDSAITDVGEVKLQQ